MKSLNNPPKPYTFLNSPLQSKISPFSCREMINNNTSSENEISEDDSDKSDKGLENVSQDSSSQDEILEVTRDLRSNEGLENVSQDTFFQDEILKITRDLRNQDEIYNDKIRKLIKKEVDSKSSISSQDNIEEDSNSTIPSQNKIPGYEVEDATTKYSLDPESQMPDIIPYLSGIIEISDIISFFLHMGVLSCLLLILYVYICALLAIIKYL